jgi:hypothetical protein
MQVASYQADSVRATHSLCCATQRTGVGATRSNCQQSSSERSAESRQRIQPATQASIERHRANATAFVAARCVPSELARDTLAKLKVRRLGDGGRPGFTLGGELEQRVGVRQGCGAQLTCCSGTRRERWPFSSAASGAIEAQKQRLDLFSRPRKSAQESQARPHARLVRETPDRYAAPQLLPAVVRVQPFEQILQRDAMQRIPGMNPRLGGLRLDVVRASLVVRFFHRAKLTTTCSRGALPAPDG